MSVCPGSDGNSMCSPVRHPQLFAIAALLSSGVSCGVNVNRTLKIQGDTSFYVCRHQTRVLQYQRLETVKG